MLRFPGHDVGAGPGPRAAAGPAPPPGRAGSGRRNPSRRAVRTDDVAGGDRGVAERPAAGSAVHSMATAPDVNPAPNATMTIWSPTLTRPSLTASARAIGTDAADVLPYRSRLTNILLHRQVEALGDGLDDPDVGLVRDEQVDVRRAPARLVHGGERGGGERPGREPVGLLALHPDVVLAAGDRLGRRRALGAAGRQPDHVGALRLGRQLDAHRRRRLVRRRTARPPRPRRRTGCRCSGRCSRGTGSAARRR